MSTGAGEFADRLGIEILEAGVDRVVARMPVDGNRQPFGALHGGAFCALGETAGSVAATLHAGPGAYAVGLDLNATHHRPARTGWVTATATPLALGRTSCTHQVEIRDDEGLLVSTVRITNLLRRHPVEPASPELTDGARSIDLGALPLELDGLTGFTPVGAFDEMEIGVWEHGVGSSDDAEADEVAVVLAGRGTVALPDGSVLDLRPGVVFSLRAGEATTWTVTEPLRKMYLARR